MLWENKVEANINWNEYFEKVVRKEKRSTWGWRLFEMKQMNVTGGEGDR